MCCNRGPSEVLSLVKDPELVRGKELVYLEFILCAMCFMDRIFRYLDSALFKKEIVSVPFSNLSFKLALLVFSSLTDNLA